MFGRFRSSIYRCTFPRTLMRNPLPNRPIPSPFHQAKRWNTTAVSGMPSDGTLLVLTAGLITGTVVVVDMMMTWDEPTPRKITSALKKSQLVPPLSYPSTIVLREDLEREIINASAIDYPSDGKYIVIYGNPQSGKSTLLHHALQHRKAVSEFRISKNTEVSSELLIKKLTGLSESAFYSDDKLIEAMKACPTVPTIVLNIDHDVSDIGESIETLAAMIAPYCHCIIITSNPTKCLTLFRKTDKAVQVDLPCHVICVGDLQPDEAKALLKTHSATAALSDEDVQCVFNSIGTNVGTLTKLINAVKTSKDKPSVVVDDFISHHLRIVTLQLKHMPQYAEKILKAVIKKTGKTDISLEMLFDSTGGDHAALQLCKDDSLLIFHPKKLCYEMRSTALKNAALATMGPISNRSEPNIGHTTDCLINYQHDGYNYQSILFSKM